VANVQGLDPPSLLPFDPIEEELLGRPPDRSARAALLGGAIAFGLGLAGGTGAAFLIDWRSLSRPPSAPAGAPEPAAPAVPADATPTAALLQVEAPPVVDPARAPSEPAQVIVEVTTAAAAATIEEHPAQAAPPVLPVEPAAPAQAAEAAAAAASTPLRDRLAAIRSSIDANRRGPPRPEAR
jgi:hypothetical protein